MSNNKTTQRPDDLHAFVEAYFSHLSFAPHVPKEFQTFLKSHLNAFALSMRAKYRPAIIVADSVCEDRDTTMFNTPGSIVIIPMTRPLGPDEVIMPARGGTI